MRYCIVFSVVFVSLMVAAQAARLPRDDKAVSDMINNQLTNNGNEAETRSKISDITKSVSGTVTKYFNNGKATIENQLKDLRKASSEQFTKLSNTFSKTYDSVRSSITGSAKKPDVPKTESSISALGN